MSRVEGNASARHDAIIASEKIYSNMHKEFAEAAINSLHGRMWKSGNAIRGHPEPSEILIYALKA